MVFVALIDNSVIGTDIIFILKDIKPFIRSHIIYFVPWVYPKGYLVIAIVFVFVCQCVRQCVRPSLNISETAHLFFLIFCVKLRLYKGTKVTEPDF